MGKEMKVLVISGFLGAGKTTFIQTMIRKTGKRFCILENEYAGSKVDTTILEGEDDINVWEMTEGCICCTMKNNFANKILNISGLIQPDYLIVEATGIGFLSRIIANIQTVEHEWIRLMQAITIVDAASVLEKKFQEDELYLDQVKNAQVIVLSKGESWEKEELTQAEHILHGINKNAEIITEHYSKMPEEWWNGLLVKYFNGQIAKSPESEEDRWDSLTLNDIALPDLTSLLVLMQDLINGRYGRIIRVKGILEVEKQWFICDISGERYSIRGVEQQEKINIVFIGEMLDKEALRSYFTQKKQKMKIRFKDRPYYRRPNNTVLQ